MSHKDSTQLRIEVVDMLSQGGVVVFATETAYGLGCDSTNARAVERLMAIKGRASWKTPPLIASSRAMVERETVLSERMRVLADAFWPGPLTLVVPVRAQTRLCADVIREGTVAIRVTSHPTAAHLCDALDAPLVATSANVVGSPTCYDIACVRGQFADRLLQPDLYMDAGPLEKRATSTIVAEHDDALVVLRQGSVDIARYVA